MPFVGQRRDDCSLANLRAEFASASQQEIIEKAAFYRQLAIIPGWKIDNDFVTVDADKLD